MIQPGTRWNPALRKRGTSEIRGMPGPRGLVGFVSRTYFRRFLYHSIPLLLGGRGKVTRTPSHHVAPRGGDRARAVTFTPGGGGRGGE